MKGKLSLLTLLIVSILAACSTIKYVPVKETEYITVRDSVFFRDTTIQYKIERERYTDYTGLLDTLRLSTDYAEAKAYVDTTANLLKGSIESKPEKEIQVKWKEKVVYRDSLVYKEVPVPVEVEKPVKYIPFIVKILAWIGGLALAAFLTKIALKYFVKV